MAGDLMRCPGGQDVEAGGRAGAGSVAGGYQLAARVEAATGRDPGRVGRFAGEDDPGR